MTSPVTISEPVGLMKQKDVIAEFGVPRQMLRDACKSGRLHYKQRGRMKLYNRQQIRRWLLEEYGETDAGLLMSDDLGNIRYVDENPADTKTAEEKMEHALRLLGS